MLNTNTLNMEVDAINKTETGELAQGKSTEVFSTEHLKADFKGRFRCCVKKHHFPGKDCYFDNRTI